MIGEPRKLALPCALAVILGAGTSWAEGVDRAGAELLFDQGRNLLKEGKVAEACPKFEQSQALDPGVGTLMNLAACFEQLGRTASAWTRYREAASAARAAGQADRDQYARERAAALEAKLSRLVVRVPAPVEGLQILTGEASLAAPLWGQPVPVDPGKVRVEARYPGAPPWVREVDVPPGGGNVEVEVPPPSGSGSPSPPTSAAPAGAAAPTPQGAPPAAQPAQTASEDTGASESSGGFQRTAGWVVAGVGAAGIVVGSVFGVKAISDNSDSKAFCASDDPTFCESEGVALREDAQSAGTLSTVGFAVGAAALAGGLVLVFTAPDDDAQANGRRFVAAPTIGPDQLGVVLQGTL